MSYNYFSNCALQLSTVKRYSQSTLNCPESVLEHTGMVCLLSFYIGRIFEKNNVKINFKCLLEKSLFHDFDEIATGDVARPVKYHSQEMRNLFKELESKNMKEISEKSNDETIYLIWESAKSDFEGRIVSFCDFICVVEKLYDEIVNRNNLTMVRYYSPDYFNSISHHTTSILNSHETLNNFPKEFKDLIDSITKKLEKIREICEMVRTNEN